MYEKGGLDNGSAWGSWGGEALGKVVFALAQGELELESSEARLAGG